MSYSTQRHADQIIRATSGRKQLSILVPLIAVTAADFPHRVSFSIDNPSSRLSMIVEVFFEADAWPGTQILHDAAEEYWVLWAATKGVTSGLQQMYILEDTEPLPRAYEVDSGITNYIIYSLVNAPFDTVAAARRAGKWYGRVRWEPNCEISDAELTQLFSLCQVSQANVAY